MSKIDEIAGKFIGWCLVISLTVAIGSICIGGAVYTVKMAYDRVVEAFND